MQLAISVVAASDMGPRALDLWWAGPRALDLWGRGQLVIYVQWWTGRRYAAGPLSAARASEYNLTSAAPPISLIGDMAPPICCATHHPSAAPPITLQWRYAKRNLQPLTRLQPSAGREIVNWEKGHPARSANSSCLNKVQFPNLSPAPPCDMA